MSEKDYYKILGVDKNVSENDLKKAYKKLALKWHPDRVPPEKKEEAQAKFQEIGEAFDVLSDPEKRRMYDLGGGMPFGGDGGGGGGGPSFFKSTSGNGTTRTFHFGGGANADEIFRKFFGTSDPFAAGGPDDDGPFGNHFSFGSFGGPGVQSSMGGIPGMAGMSMGGMPGMSGMNVGSSQPLRQAPAVQHDLNVSLEDIYKGTTKRVRITAKKLIDNSGRTQSVSSEKEIKIKPGWKDGTKITFSGEGDQAPGVKPADIVFVLKSKPHDSYSRDGDDLIHYCTITLEEALCTGINKNIITLDGRSIPIRMNNITPDTVKIIPGEGMPNSKTQSKGDLRIKFIIKFPELTTKQRNDISTILSQSRGFYK